MATGKIGLGRDRVATSLRLSPSSLFPFLPKFPAELPLRRSLHDRTRSQWNKRRYLETRHSAGDLWDERRSVSLVRQEGSDRFPSNLGNCLATLFSKINQPDRILRGQSNRNNDTAARTNTNLIGNVLAGLKLLLVQVPHIFIIYLPSFDLSACRAGNAVAGRHTPG
jgi:hypothetical protein